MSTGGIAVLLGQTPLRFKGLTVIGKIFFLLDLCMLLIGIALMLTRFIVRPRVINKSMHHPPEALFFGAFWVSLALILNCTQIYGVPACGPWLVTALRVSFWLYAALVLLVAIFQYAKIFVAERMQVSDAMPAWILPMYPFLVLGPLAATLAPSQPREHAILMLVGGIMFQGLGWMATLFMYTIYVLRLMSSEIPSPPTRPGMFIGVGPAGYTSQAFVALGVQAQKILPDNYMGDLSVPCGDVLRILGLTAGLFVWLLAFWFFALTLWGIVEGFRDMSFTLAWWAFIFPNVGLILATIQIGNAVESQPIKILTAIMTILIVVVWLVVAGACIKAVVLGEIMSPGKDEDKDIDV